MIDTHRLTKNIKRYRKLLEKDNNKKRGNETEYTFHGGYTNGYLARKLSAFEDIADELGLDITELTND